MARPKKEKEEKVVETDSQGTHEVEESTVPEQSAPPANESVKAKTFPNDTWIYSMTEEPRILKAGDPMPKGFTRDFKTVKGIWTNDATGKWKKQEEKKA